MERELKKEIVPHPHAKKWLIATAIILFLSLSGSGYFGYWYKIRKEKTQAEEQARLAEEARKTKEAEEKKKAEKAAAAAATAATLKQEVKAIDVAEIQTTVAELKDAMGAFNR